MIFRLRFKQMSCLQVNETCLSQSHLTREWIRAGSISNADERQMLVGFLTSEKKVLVGVCGFSLTTGEGPRISWLWRKIGKALIGKKVANFTTHANYTLEKVNLIAMSIWYTILYTCLLWANLCSFFFVFVLLVGASSVTRDQNKVLLWLDLIINALVKFKV